MLQLNNTSHENNPARKAPASKAKDRVKKKSPARLIIVAVFIALILTAVGAGFYFSEEARYNRLTIITVDSASVKMPYFLKRTWIADGDPMYMLQALTDELIIREGATRLVGEISPEEVDRELRRMAGGQDETVSESEFGEWYRQQLNNTKLSNSEYREIVVTGLLTNRLQEYLAQRVSTVAEQVHLHAIVVSTFDAAEKARTRLEVGEDFTAIAREVSVDKQYRDNEGDVGWKPRGILPSWLDDIIFGLSIGEVSEPIPYASPSSTDTKSSENLYYLFMVSEKADIRQVDEDSLQILKDNVIDVWLLEEAKLHNTTFNFNSEIYAWINLQIAKK